MANHTLFICELCRFSATEATWQGRSGGALLTDPLQQGLATRGLNERLSLVPVRYLGKPTFLFGDRRPGPTETATAVLDFAEQYVRLGDGKVPYKQRDPLLQQGMVAVVPAVREAPSPVRSP